MGNESPLICIGMPVYNESKWIQQALDKLLSQTFENFQLVISDNVSTDDTWNILQRYAVKDRRIILHHQMENLGAVNNFKFVLQQARGKYFMWASGHDLWSPNLLEVLVDELQTDPKVALCIPHSQLIDEEENPLQDYDQIIDTRVANSPAGRMLAMHRQMKRANAIYGLHRRRVLMKTLPWPRVVGFDNIILMRIAAQGDVLTNQSAQWYRRMNRQETSDQVMQRRVNSTDISILAAKFPRLFTRALIMMEFSKASGSWHEKLALLAYGFKRFYLASGQAQLLFRELLAGSLRCDRNFIKGGSGLGL